MSDGAKQKKDKSAVKINTHKKETIILLAKAGTYIVNCVNHFAYVSVFV